MWLASTFALVFLGFLVSTGVAVAGVTSAAYRGSWRAGAISLAGAATIAILLGLRVASRVSFAGTYLPEVAGSWLITVAVAGGGAAVWMRMYSPSEGKWRLIVPLVLAFVLWGALGLFLGGGGACNLDAECY